MGVCQCRITSHGSANSDFGGVVVGCQSCRQAEESEATLGVMLSAISQVQGEVSLESKVHGLLFHSALHFAVQDPRERCLEMRSPDPR